MQDQSLQELLECFRIEHNKEKIALLAVPMGREAFIQILIELQLSPNNRRMGANELAKTVAAVRYLKTPLQEIVEMPILKMMAIEKWNLLREKAECDKSPFAKDWIRQREKAASVRGELLLRLLPKIRSHVIKRFAQRGLDVEHMVNEGVIGVARAMEKYDSERGKRFIDYAMTWVDSRIYDAFEKNSPVTLTSSLAAIRSKIKASRERLTASLERPPEDAEIARDLGITESEYRRAYVRVDSLDASVGGEDGEGMTLGETIEVEETFACEYDRTLAANHIAKMLEGLSGNDRDVTLFRLPPTGFEFGGMIGLSVNEAAEVMREIAVNAVEAELKREAASSK